MTRKNNRRKAPRGNKAMKEGYLTFDVLELLDLSKSGGPYAEAYAYLYAAVTTSANTEKDVDDVFPITAEETARMAELLDKAEKAAPGNDPQFISRLNELRAVTDWSGERHWNFQWALIAGVIATVLFLTWRVDKNQEKVSGKADLVAQVENWKEADTTITWESMPEDLFNNGFYFSSFADPRLYKVFQLWENKVKYNSSMGYAEEYAASADTARSEEDRKNLLKYSKDAAENAAEYREEYDRINAMDFKEVQEMAMEDAGGMLERAKGDMRAVRAWNIFFLLLIPVYIFAERPYGYSISRYRAEARVLGGIRKFSYALSGILAGSAASMGYIKTVTKWSDGRTESSYDAAHNVPIMVMKGLMYVAAIALVCVVSCLLMLYMTIQGLRRNYDWTSIIGGMKKKLDKNNAVS